MANNDKDLFGFPKTPKREPPDADNVVQFPGSKPETEALRPSQVTFDSALEAIHWVDKHYLTSTANDFEIISERDPNTRLLCWPWPISDRGSHFSL